VIRARLRGRRRTCPSAVAARPDTSRNNEGVGGEDADEGEISGDYFSIVLDELEFTDARPALEPRRCARLVRKRSAVDETAKSADKRTRISTSNGGARRPPLNKVFRTLVPGLTVRTYRGPFSTPVYILLCCVHVRVDVGARTALFPFAGRDGPEKFESLKV
jgi:hypothetical protein